MENTGGNSWRIPNENSLRIPTEILEDCIRKFLEDNECISWRISSETFEEFRMKFLENSERNY